MDMTLSEAVMIGACFLISLIAAGLATFVICWITEVIGRKIDDGRTKDFEER